MQPQHLVTRFAPSPTGPLHLGHAYAAVTARSAAASCRLRLDDLDPARARPEHAEKVLRQLDWLGLSFDGPVVRQSERVEAYEAALGRLVEADLAYPCTCTRADIAAAVAAPHGPLGARYPGTCRNRAASPGHGPVAWRFDSGKALGRLGTVAWREGGVAHWVTKDAVDDVVLRRRDGAAAYHLATVVDDAAMGVDLVVRGLDLRPSAPVQALLRAALSLPEPEHRHHALVLDGEGRRLATRDRAASLDAFAAAGWAGPALAEALARDRPPLPTRLSNA